MLCTLLQRDWSFKFLYLKLFPLTWSCRCLVNEYTYSNIKKLKFSFLKILKFMASKCFVYTLYNWNYLKVDLYALSCNVKIEKWLLKSSYTYHTNFLYQQEKFSFMKIAEIRMLIYDKLYESGSIKIILQCKDSVVYLIV